jgi:hypothetical protein
MDITRSWGYQRFEDFVNGLRKNNRNGAVVELQGFGGTTFSKVYCEVNPQVKYINETAAVLSTFNIVDLDYSDGVLNLDVAQKYYSALNTNQKILYIISNPGILTSKKNLVPDFLTHLYDKLYLQAENEEGVKEIIDRVGTKVDKKQLNKIYDWTGGIPKLVKYLALNINLLEKNLEETAENSDIKIITDLLRQEIVKCDAEQLGKMNLIKQGKWVSKLLKYVFDNNPRLEINPDMTFWENGKYNSNRLTLLEKEILEKCLNNGNLVEREYIANIKWGDMGDEGFSDEAITKNISRLNKKMKIFRLKSLRELGYRLE